ncbi:CD209 antigen-like isoform X2 [Cheilinus undulatus]|uniref:CD209 antigen-like isoform X2 n=1 Tax=Cheilinus undulatus TaxID=241271 RepID=UPI001BD66361|nr:CD209 antigen-like isoform X2 [Cheilinus undulatus]
MKSLGPKVIFDGPHVRVSTVTAAIAAKLNDQMRGSEEVIQHCKHVTDKLTLDNVNLEKNNSRLRDQVEKLDQASTALENDISNLRTENQRLNESIKNLEKERRQLNDSSEHLAKENQRLTGENQRLKDREEHLKKEIQRLSESNTYLKKATSAISATQNPPWVTHEYTTNQTFTGGRWRTEDYSTSPYPWFYRKKRQTEPCPAGWLHFLSSCYVISPAESPDQRNWEEAQDDCRGKEADLVVIESPEEQEFIYKSGLTSSGDSGFWIGLKTEGGIWKWVNGDHLTEGYGMKEPANDHHCVISAKEKKGWEAVSCDVKHGWICEVNASSLPLSEGLFTQN